MDSYKNIDIFNNKYIMSILMMIVVTYGSIYAPNLPRNYANYLSHPLIKILIIVLILVVKKYNVLLSVMLSVCFVITMQTVNRYNIYSIADKISESTKNKIEK